MSPSILSFGSLVVSVCVLCRLCCRQLAVATRLGSWGEKDPSLARVYCDTTGRLMPDIDTFSFSYMPADVMSAVMEVQ